MDQGVSFSGYRFEVESGRLWAGKRELHLTPKASAVLKELVSHAGRPVSKDSLFATVWSGIAVSDDALTSCIQELRRAFGDDPRQPRFIETRHRRGYRFVAPLDERPAVSASDELATAAISAIAVLPFADMSPNHDQDYFCDGLAEELINALTQISGLRVASRTASFQFRDINSDVRAIGRQLGVGTLLEGSVRKADDQLRITVQLIEVASGYHRWSQRFDRTMDDVFAIQDEIAESVANSLRGTALSAPEKQALVRPQTGREAYEYYLRGRQYLPRLTTPDLEASAEMFERAIGFDGAYGPAFAGLAMVHATLYEWFGARKEDLLEAERSGQRALEIAPQLAETHVALGCVLSLSRRYDEAGRAFEEAVRINPYLFDAYYYHARTAFAGGKISQSADLFRRACDVRQEDFQSPILLEQSLRMLGRLDEANAAGREGLRRAEQVLALNPLDVRALSLGSLALATDGQNERALEWCRRSLELSPDDMGALIVGACLHLRLARKEAALDLLDRVFARGWGKRDWIDHDPDYDIVRDHPRFKKLVAKLT